MRVDDLTVELTGIKSIDSELQQFNDLARELKDLLKDVDPNDLDEIGSTALNNTYQQLQERFKELSLKRNKLEDDIEGTRAAIKERGDIIDKAMSIVDSMLARVDKAIEAANERE